MTRLMQIKSVDAYDWTEMLRASRAEGHSMIQRLLSDFRLGANRFDAPGEILYAHFSDQVPIAVCGLNRETQLSFLRCGRVRRLYGMPSFRRDGVARDLLEAVIEHALSHFVALTVNVGKTEAHGFYEHLGFVRVQHSALTHTLSLISANEARSTAS